MKQAGYALLLLMGGLAMAGMFLIQALGRGPDRVPDWSEIAQRRLEAIADGAVLAHRGAREFPGSLGGLVPWLPIDSLGAWRSDPHAPGSDLVYQVTGNPSVLTARSVGADGLLGTADDLVVSRDSETLKRQDARNRLRILRATFFRDWVLVNATPPGGGGGKKGNGAPGGALAYTMTAADRAAYIEAMHEWWIAQRHLLYVTGNAANKLRADMNGAQGRISALWTKYSLPALPANATGSGGLLEQLGLDDGWGSDFFGRTFIVNQYVAFLCLGGDGVEGTNDDM